MTDTTVLPPYGLFAGRLEELAQRSEPMEHWRPNLPLFERRETFLAWRTTARDRIAATVWPRFDRATRAWQGAATARALDLTLADIAIMIDAFQGGTPVGLRPAPVCPTPRFGTTHREQFIAEDDPKEPIGVNVGDYVCSLSDAEIAKVMQEMEIALDSTKLQGLFWLKRELCRPRPYQTALLLGINGFYYDRAISATHSSIYSGHCLEGILSAATVFDRWRNDSRYSNEDIDRLAHYAVDFGDRRVFAGVHYPSDNVVSWWMAASLIGELFADPEPVRAFVVAAVRTHSLVYRAIAERIGEDALNGARVLLEEVDLLNEQSNS